MVRSTANKNKKSKAKNQKTFDKRSKNLSQRGSLKPSKSLENEIQAGGVMKTTAGLFNEVLMKRSLFYSISIFVVFQFLLTPLNAGVNYVFWMICGVGYLIVIAEILSSRIYDTKRSKSNKSKLLTFDFKGVNIIHHFVLPSLLYISGAFFLYFNRTKLLDQVAIVLLTVCFFLLFFNISSTYEKLYSASRRNKYIFDFCNIIIFFFVIDVFVNVVFFFGAQLFLIFIAVIVLTVLLIYLMTILSDQQNFLIYSGIVLSALFVGIWAFICIILGVFNVTVLSFVLTVGFYLVDVYWHHKLEGSFSWQVMFEYVIFAIMSIILLLYL
ncbi:hypothetical protein JW887_06750 [Candidatus Dojkabacteria bacterium]|nr:hypothetical protein [Candidatus Dojkabacteria bacterium]